jgi:hypothetical protein
VKQHLLLKVEAITEQIEALEILKSELVGLLSGWQEQPPQGSDCPDDLPKHSRSQNGLKVDIAALLTCE